MDMSRRDSYLSLKDFDTKRTSKPSRVVQVKAPKERVIERSPSVRSAKSGRSKHAKLTDASGPPVLQRRNSVPNVPLLDAMDDGLSAADYKSPLFKDPAFRSFLEKRSGDTRGRADYDGGYGECLARIRRRVAGHKIWASLDETVDPVDGRLVGNVVIGTLSPDGPGETFLLAAGPLRCGDDGGGGGACTGQAAARLFDDAMGLLWPDGVRHGDVLLLLQSAASRTAARTADCLSAVYAKMIAVACPARELRAVAERICAGHPAVDSLVANVSRVCSGDPAWFRGLRAHAPGTPPPRPLLRPAAGHSSAGRWATAWIEAASYVSDNFRAIRHVLADRADPARDSGPAPRARRLADEPAAESGLALVDYNYGFLPAAVARIEARGAPLGSTVAAVLRAADRLAEVDGEGGAAARRRFADALHENRGFRALAAIAEITAGRGAAPPDGLPAHLSADDLKYFAYAPVAAVDVRHTFPRYDAVASSPDRRHDENGLDKTMVVQCNRFSADPFGDA